MSRKQQAKFNSVGLFIDNKTALFMKDFCALHEDEKAYIRLDEKKKVLLIDFPDFKPENAAIR